MVGGRPGDGRGAWAARSGCSCRGGIMVGICVLGYWVFNREAPRIAEEL